MLPRCNAVHALVNIYETESLTSHTAFRHYTAGACTHLVVHPERGVQSCPAAGVLRNASIKVSTSITLSTSSGADGLCSDANTDAGGGSGRDAGGGNDRDAGGGNGRVGKQISTAIREVPVIGGDDIVLDCCTDSFYNRNMTNRSNSNRSCPSVPLIVNGSFGTAAAVRINCQLTRYIRYMYIYIM